jgi:antitoxin (DNA-binding transcriptional repressor) of toxin-antitoxin stability system
MAVKILRYNSAHTIAREYNSKGGRYMQIALSDLKTNVVKYVDLAETQDIIVTKYGSPVAKITRYNKEPWYMKKMPEKVTSVEQLFGTLPSDVDLDDIKAERLSR